MIRIDALKRTIGGITYSTVDCLKQAIDYKLAIIYYIMQITNLHVYDSLRAP